MNPLGHIVSLTSSTVTSWCFSVGVVVVVVVVAMDAKGTRVEKGASEWARRDASVAVATRLAAAIRSSSIRSIRRRRSLDPSSRSPPPPPPRAYFFATGWSTFSCV
jgi:hypothetical protein